MTSLNVYEPQVQAFEQTVKQGESWQDDHHEAMWCRHVEDIVKVGIVIYDMLNSADEDWRLDFATGETTEDLTEQVDTLFAWWLRPCDTVERWIIGCESKGYSVDGASDFRIRHSRVRSSIEDAAAS